MVIFGRLWYMRAAMAQDIKQKGSIWRVYILCCADGTLYTGVTTCLDRRLSAHQKGTASRYTRSRLPVTLLLASLPMNRSQALRLEIEIKKLPKARKLSRLAFYCVTDID